MPLPLRAVNLLLVLPHVGIGVLWFPTPTVLAILGMSGPSPLATPFTVVIGMGLMLAQGALLVSAVLAPTRRTRHFVSGLALAMVWMSWAGVAVAWSTRAAPDERVLLPMALTVLATAGVPGFLALTTALSSLRWRLPVAVLALCTVLASGSGTAAWIRTHQVLWGTGWVFEAESLLFALYQLTLLPTLVVLLAESWATTPRHR